jgi:hypothetical protein
MFLKNKENGEVLEVLDMEGVIDPNIPFVKGRYHAGEEMPEPTEFHKDSLQFPSGEELPRCWKDPHYRD